MAVGYYAYGPQHLFSSHSLLGLVVTGPFLAKTAVQNTNLGIISVNTAVVLKFAGHIRRIRPDQSRDTHCIHSAALVLLKIMFSLVKTA